MQRMLVIADDLSGAADCGVACSSHGLSAVVLLDEIENEIEADVLSVDSDTRYAAPEKAAAETAKLTRRYGRERLLFKKIDSTLRGNVAVELAAALYTQRELTGKRVVVVLAPAFPAHGRTTRDGRQLLHGRPIEEADLWLREPVTPLSHIPTLLQTAGLLPAVIPLSLVRSAPDTLRVDMQQMAEKADVLICDAEDEDDLRAIAEASTALGTQTIWAGSAGLAWHLPRAAGLARSTPCIIDRPALAGPVLFVMGSLSPVSREQVRTLVSSSDVLPIVVSPETLLSGAESPEWHEHQAAMRDALTSGKDVVLTVAADRLIAQERGQALCAALAQMAAPCPESIGALVASGGETARAVLQAFGITRLRLIGEVEAGLPFSLADGWNRPLPVLTRAGGFGTPQTLLHCLRFLREPDRHAADSGSTRRF
ncbi:four-carbon acid sugar kinase family protein [Paracidobacterium acidisoli]|uniref:Four-carbon acid sugar kinase family protein n=1 Tax=Paracidobacterium acidisoli TaxID=2303751 RepID=A0A372IUD3_9BACT|nr:four-carbon acid sugar kinase family protein [Paracidobacterium acidisoli]MBT9329979.1 four-carbon acid sugar kinase family protein [Paracidobacterium acidisoli]